MSISINKQFKEILPEYQKLAEKSPKFKDFLAKQTDRFGNRTKNLDKGKDSAKIFFAVVCAMKYLIEEQKQLAEKAKGENNGNNS